MDVETQTGNGIVLIFCLSWPKIAFPFFVCECIMYSFILEFILFFHYGQSQCSYGVKKNPENVSSKKKRRKKQKCSGVMDL